MYATTAYETLEDAEAAVTTMKNTLDLTLLIGVFKPSVK